MGLDGALGQEQLGRDLPAGQMLGIKEFGLALAIAVEVDATLVSCLLVPARAPTWQSWSAGKAVAYYACRKNLLWVHAIVGWPRI